MIVRQPEAELMTDAEQARAYAAADFSLAHTNLLSKFDEVFPRLPAQVQAADLGCGPADIAIRLAHAHRGWHIDAIDGSAAMLAHGEEAVKAAGLERRICLRQCVFPDVQLRQECYDVIVSNSLLHHLHDPQVLWTTIKEIAAPGTVVFISDLRRLNSRDEIMQIVERYADGEHEILRRDFYNSLFAAFTPVEVSRQLQQAGMKDLTVESVGDRHLVIYGILPATADAN